MAGIDRVAWHAMMARAYGCVDEIEVVVGSAKCDHCGEWHPIPEAWPKEDDPTDDDADA